MKGYAVFRGSLAGLVLVTGIFAGCSSGPCPCVPATSQPSLKPDSTLYVGSGNPYEPGALSVKKLALVRCESDAPFPLDIYAPENGGSYAVVVFQHGFLARNSHYRTILTRLASHGFIVVAPQMYEPGLGVLVGNPTVAMESQWAITVLDWLAGHLDNVTGLSARTDRLGLSGHSRGGKVIWQVLGWDTSRAKAVAGIDPVDGDGGPLGNQPRVIQGPFSFAFPSLVIGTGLGGDCAPEGDNHVQFYDASPSPAWHVVALKAGHTDMLDDGVRLADYCSRGPDPEGMRKLTAGLLTAFFRGALQGDASAFAVLTDTALAPVLVTAEAK